MCNLLNGEEFQKRTRFANKEFLCYPRTGFFFSNFLCFYWLLAVMAK